MKKKFYLTIGGILTILGAGGAVQINTADMRQYRNELVDKQELNASEAIVLYKMKDKTYGIDIKPKNLQQKANKEYKRNKDILFSAAEDGIVTPDEFQLVPLYMNEEVKGKKFKSSKIKDIIKDLK